MKNIRISILFLILLSCNQEEQRDINWLYDWIEAWELVNKDILNLPNKTVPDMIFFDSERVVTNISGYSHNLKIISGPKFFKKDVEWYEYMHNDSIALPNGSKLPLGIYSFASPNGDNPFFVMPAPAYWIENGESGEGISIDKHLTGVFLHEFSHVRQFSSVSETVIAIDKKFHLDSLEVLENVGNDDDMIQDFFGQDSVYSSHFKNEVDFLYSAYLEKDDMKALSMLTTALERIEQRRSTYFIEEKEVFTEFDKLFLAFEGTGQYLMYAWLTHTNGGNVPRETALRATRRDKSYWSQEEGLALVLNLQRHTSINWSNEFYDSNASSIVDKLKELVKTDDNNGYK